MNLKKTLMKKIAKGLKLFGMEQFNLKSLFCVINISYKVYNETIDVFPGSQYAISAGIGFLR